MAERNAEITYRDMGEQASPGRAPQRLWQVEYHEGQDFPSDLAWVLVPPDSEHGADRGAAATAGDGDGDAAGGRRPRVAYVLVADDRRRQGIATALVRACRERWPGVELARPVTWDGARLFEKIQPITPESVYSPEDIARATREGMPRDELTNLARWSVLREEFFY
jgi:GNAT superfamily N-acetyltransferase